MHPPTRPVAAIVLAAAAVLALAVPARAAASTSTTSTTSSSSTSSTTSTTSTASDTSSTSTSSTSTSTTSTTAATSTTTSTSSTTSTTVDWESLPPGDIPPGVQAMIDAYPRTPSGTTRDLVDALDALPPQLALAAFGRFPVGGLATWSHDWLFPRHRPSFHVHEGTDVFASRGTPVRAPAGGTVRVSSSGIGGRAVKVVQDDGTYWYLAHLDEVRVATGDEVVPGVIVGTVGDSGNAKGGAPHVHVEVHPYGGEPLDPKGLLDLAYAEALAAAPAVIAAFEARSILTADRIDPVPPELVPEPVPEPVDDFADLPVLRLLTAPPHVTAARD